jgi:CxxC motif-containing protein (DUF1111 family)
MATELGIVAGESQDGGLDQDRQATALESRLTNYLRLLAVPARRLKGEDTVERGAQTFVQSGCAMCHTPSRRTGHMATLPRQYQDLPIFPFTDMLLHDMGPGLSDFSGSELSRFWRTPALWGIGVQHGVSPDVGFLHDGRARSLTEAILWHDGEARYAAGKFKALTREHRADLLAFLYSL